jgi:cell division protein FtsB
MTGLLRSRAAIAWTGVCLGLLGLSSLDPGGLRKWRRLAADARRVEAENRDVQRENERLRREVRALQGDARALERAAREDHGYDRPGDNVLKHEEEPAP